MALKEKLLSLGIVENNEYLDKYVELIESNRETKREKFKTQKHHIIPKYYYKTNHLVVDNSKSNVVEVSYKNHILLHYYLALCSIDIYKYKSYHSFLYLYKIINNRNEIIDKNNLIIEISKLEYFDCLYQEDKKLESKNLAGGKWMTNDKTQQYVRSDRIQYFESLGYHIGKLPFSEKQYEALAKIQKKNIGTHHTKEWNDNISNANKGRKLSKESIEKISNSLKGNVPWNKGLTKDDERVAKNIANGFSKTQYKKGDIPWNLGKKWSKESKDKMSNSHKGKPSSTLNRICIYRLEDDSQKFVKKEELNDYLALGYIKGKRPNKNGKKK